MILHNKKSGDNSKVGTEVQWGHFGISSGLSLIVAR